MADLLRELEGQELVLGLVLVGAGLAFMLLGVRIFNVLVAISFGAVGLVLGQMLPVSEPARWVCGLVAGVGLAVASTRVVKLAVALLAGGWAGYLVAALTARSGLGEQVTLGAGACALIIAVSLAFIMYHEAIAFVTSLEGALLFLGGLVVFISHTPSLWNHLRSMVMDNAIFGPFLVLGGTVTGFYFQLADLRQKQSGTTG